METAFKRLSAAAAAGDAAAQFVLDLAPLVALARLRDRVARDAERARRVCRDADGSGVVLGEGKRG